MQFDLDARRDDHGAHVAIDDEGLIFVPAHCAYSVVTVAPS